MVLVFIFTTNILEGCLFVKRLQICMEVTFLSLLMKNRVLRGKNFLKKMRLGGVAVAVYVPSEFLVDVGEKL